MEIITIKEVSDWMNDPMIEQGAESDYWDTVSKDNPDAVSSFDLVMAFLWIRKYIKSLTN
jgi:hypothetical protein